MSDSNVELTLRSRGNPLRDKGNSILEHSTWDALLVALAGVHAAILVACPAAPVIALGVWWNSNTIAHHFIHNPFFRSRALNRLFSAFLSGLLGIPQSLWRDRHLAHHANQAWRLRWSPFLVLETSLVLLLWAGLLVTSPEFFLLVYLPGFGAGLLLCALQGTFEHRNGGTTSHYGSPYNVLFFRDGYHVEHHVNPARHWTALERHRAGAARASRFPPILRWLEVSPLDVLEGFVVKSRWLQRFVLARHERALQRLLPSLPPVTSVAIVGGGLFPRTALILRRLLPNAKLVVIDHQETSLALAQGSLPSGVESRLDTYDRERHGGFDLVVIPLAYVGDRSTLYACPPAPAMLVHDWLWRRRGLSTIVSVSLLKRLNLILR